MSRTTVLVCDLCGIEIPTYYSAKENSAQIKIWHPNDYRGSGGQRIDLCLECYNKFVSFLDGERKEEKQ